MTKSSHLNELLLGLFPQCLPHTAIQPAQNSSNCPSSTFRYALILITPHCSSAIVWPLATRIERGMVSHCKNCIKDWFPNKTPVIPLGIRAVGRISIVIGRVKLVFE